MDNRQKQPKKTPKQTKNRWKTDEKQTENRQKTDKKTD